MLAPECFSASFDNLTYERYIVIYPGLAQGFPVATSYSMKLRVKKRYGATPASPMWSDWSAVRNISISTTSFDPKSGDPILASHYNTMKDTVSRVTYAYDVAWSAPVGNVVAKSTTVQQSQFPYVELFNKVVDVKTRINSYTTFDAGRSNVKIDENNLIPTTFTSLQELITADTLAEGRNYIKILYDRCSYLK